MRTRIPISFTVLTLLVFIGCSSGGGTPTLPLAGDNPPDESVSVQTNRLFLNIGDVIISADRQTVEVIPNRDVAMHLNILPFIEQCPDCLWFSDFEIYDSTNFSCDIKLKHPLPNLPQYTIFDMRFIFITDADYTFPGSGKKISFDGSNPRILNPSGYTTLFNPTDFPYNEDTPIITYFPGIASFGDNFSATLNPFLAFGRQNPRCMISSGEEDHRRARLNVPVGPLKFGYAVDASWMEIDTWNDPVNDFPMEANCLEACQVFAVMNSWPDSGGSEQIKVTVYDHQGISTVNNVSVEAPGLFDGVVELTQSVAGENSAEYTGTIFNDSGGTINDSPILIRVVDTGIDEFSGQIDAWQVLFTSTEGNLIWVKNGGGNDVDKATAITSLSDDSVVITGHIRTSSIFGKGEPNQTVLTSAGHRDVFFARYNPDGTLAWAKRAGGSITDYGWGITALSDNSTVATGWFYSTPTIFGQGEPNQTSLTPVGRGDVYIARFNPDGTLAWVTSAGGPDNDGGFGIITLSDDSTVVTGTFRESATFGQGEPNQTVITSAGITDAYVARYNTDGTLAWAKRGGGSSQDRGREVTVLSDDSTVVTGHFFGPAIFGEGETNETVLPATDADTDVFIARYNADGTLAWVKCGQGSPGSYVMGNGITALSDNSVVVTGEFTGSVTFGKGETNYTVLISAGGVDIFIARFNMDGTLVWAKRTGGSSSDYGFEIKALSDDSTVLTGRYWMTDPGQGDILISRYSTNGTLVWTKSAGGSYRDEGFGIEVLSDDSMVVAGYFNESAIFGLYESNETVLNTFGLDDIFIARFSP
jgi:uncharacterized delta-60 repeat protein